MTTEKIDCACDKCVNACKNGNPGWFLPGEAEKAAAFMQIPFEEFEKKYLILDHCSNQVAPDAPYVYSPRRINVDEGDRIKTAESHRKKGRCVFLRNDDMCCIHPVKPFECRQTMVCGPVSTYWKVRDVVEFAWISKGAPLGMRPEVDAEEE